MLGFFCTEGGEVLEQFAQRGCGFHVPDGGQGQAGCPGQSDLVLGLSCGQSCLWWGVLNMMIVEALPLQFIL